MLVFKPSKYQRVNNFYFLLFHFDFVKQETPTF